MAGRTYRYMKKEPLYPFGFGLGFSSFEYSALKLPESVTAGDPVEVEVTVKNTGAVAGEEVVQVYVTDVEASTTAPLASLAAFQRVALEPGQSQVVTLHVAPERLELVLDDGRRVIEKGDFAVSVGGASPGPRAVALGAPTPVTGRFAVR
jgi:beta-glucosidase